MRKGSILLPLSPCTHTPTNMIILDKETSKLKILCPFHPINKKMEAGKPLDKISLTSVANLSDFSFVCVISTFVFKSLDIKDHWGENLTYA